MLNQYQEKFSSLFARYENTSLVDKCFKDLASRYSSKSRYYHNLDHLRACITHAESAGDLFDDPEAVKIALWFHDAVYSPLKGDNEKRSALLAREFLSSLGADQQYVRNVEDLILVTAHQSSPIRSDEGYVQDIDLTILGTSKSTFDNYEMAVRKEYWMFPKTVYKRGRQKILEGFLNSDRIYYSDYFYERYEANARGNLSRVLKEY